MSRQDNIAAQQQLAEKVNAGDIAGAVQSFAEDAVDHDPAPDQGPGREGFKAFFQALAGAVPDAHIESTQMVVAGDNVATAYTLTGTLGVDPTGG